LFALRPFLCVWLLIWGASACADTRIVLTSGGDDLADALERASILAAGFEAGTPVPDQIAAARADYARLIGVLYDYGHFAGVISIKLDGREAGTISPFAAPSQINAIDIQVDPGPAFTLGQVAIGPLAAGATPPEEFRAGAPASTSVLRDAARDAISEWRDAGHATAEVSGQSITARASSAELDASITIDPGRQLRFGTLMPSGQERMAPDRVAEIAGLPSGAVFSPAELDRAAERLRDTGVFSSVALNEGASNPGGTIDIEAQVVEAPLRRLGYGAELSSTEGLALSAYWLHRNLTGDGERLRFDAEITGIGQDSGEPDGRLSAQISRPATATPDTTFTASLALEYLDDDTFQELFFEGEAGVIQQISPDLSGSVAVGFRYSEISDAFGDRSVTLLTLPTGLVYDTRDDPLDAASGVYADLDITPFFVTDTGAFGGRTNLDLRGYIGFGPDERTRLAGRFQLGTVAGGEITDLPPNFLFFSGGGGTVRGQDFRSLGATQNGQETGGRSFMGISGELRQDITDTIGAVAFYDAGYIAADPIWDDSGTWHSGAGLGLRYRTPIGAIRVDLAVPVDAPTRTEDFYLYIGIGQAF